MHTVVHAVPCKQREDMDPGVLRRFSGNSFTLHPCFMMDGWSDLMRDGEGDE